MTAPEFNGRDAERAVGWREKTAKGIETALLLTAGSIRYFIRFVGDETTTVQTTLRRLGPREALVVHLSGGE
jgi:hypothetical protein